MRAPRSSQVRLLILGLGVGLALAQSLTGWERGAAPSEVFAPLLYIPVFAGAIYFGLPGAAGAVVLAAIMYLMVLAGQSSATGTRVFVGLFLNRLLTFAIYGVVVAVGTRYVESRLQKLDRYDHIDDETKLFNSAFFLEDSELEMGRSRRYNSVFSVAEVRLDRSLFDGRRRRAYQHSVKEVGDHLRRVLRAVDRPARVTDANADRFLVILPETGAEGSAVLRSRLDAGIRDLLAERRMDVDGNLSSRALSFPDDREALELLRQEVAEVDAERRLLSTAEATS